MLYEVITELYDKFVGFAQEMERVGEQLLRTQESYDLAMNRLTRGKGNLVRRVEAVITSYSIHYTKLYDSFGLG